MNETKLKSAAKNASGATKKKVAARIKPKPIKPRKKAQPVPNDVPSSEDISEAIALAVTMVAAAAFAGEGPKLLALSSIIKGAATRKPVKGQPFLEQTLVSLSKSLKVFAAKT